MAILGIGTDIIEINRIAKIVQYYDDLLAKKILSAKELLNYKMHKKPINFLAKRFVVKEAAAKALGIGIRNGIKFNQFEVFNNYLGKPELNFNNKAAKVALELQVKSIHVTIADEKFYACATVIIEG